MNGIPLVRASAVGSCVQALTSIAIPRAMLSAPAPRLAAPCAARTEPPLQALADAPPTLDFAGSLRQALAPLVSQTDIDFTRAFRRWTGLPPREFRRLHLAEGRAGDAAVPIRGGGR